MKIAVKSTWYTVGTGPGYRVGTGPLIRNRGTIGCTLDFIFEEGVLD